MNNKALWNLTYGLYLLTAREFGSDNGCIINTAMQVAEDPVRISISVIKGNKTCEMIRNTGCFNLSAITDDADFSLFTRFGMQSGRIVNKFQGFDGMARSENTVYYLTQNSNMYLSCVVQQEVDLGTHVMFIAEVVDGDVLSDKGCCTYTHYQASIKPKPQKTENTTWVCSVCGYVYEGEELPDDFLCPLCLHGKKDFVKGGNR